ncbi:TetR/AcrR family transcriptional regulator [Thermoactinospora rubra]|uniref:TetR/AcrR family transcriptional regulator n=1 Tax=Thermoactinospora rubra TaxID=1088767 RepID=UPI000A0F6D6F|nr:TetR/AcrR family transcriptional regulator [Thermoactinospora rubra]
MPTHRQETRERIVEAAAAVIDEHGVAGATTKRIAARAGCSEALLYKHFGSKEELFLAALLGRLPALGPALARLHARVGVGDLVENLTEFAVTATEFYRRAVPMAAGLVGEPALLASFRAMLESRGIGPHVPIGVLADYFRAEQEAGRLSREVDADAAAALLMGACYHRANLTYMLDLPGTTPGYARSVVTTLLAGLLPGLRR